MRKTLYLHIGHFKTGTTAIQQFLHLNPRLLKRHGLVFAQTKQEHSKHSDLAFSLYQAAGVKDLMHGYAKPETPHEVWTSVFEELRRSRRSGMIVSTEELIRLACFPKAVEILKKIVETAPDLDIKIIAYLRAPDSHLRSWYNQLVKRGCKTPSFNAAISHRTEPEHYDYALALKPWISLFGAESIFLRHYSEDSRKDRALFHDFLSIFNIEMPRLGVTHVIEDPNPRMAEDTLEVARILQNADASNRIVETSQNRSNAYFQMEETQNLARSADAFEEIRSRTLGGLDQLAQQLPEFSKPLKKFRAHLPVQEAGASSDGCLLAGLLLSERHVLRKTMNSQNWMLTERLEALEAEFSARGSKPS
ncbi:hypothetical protein [Pseudophaeobacter sp.]|uniref:hypothetical protein n=1 Tax=Pseudophaeobacter sp. TaxID=1971739 RepID=UPI00329818FE